MTKKVLILSLNYSSTPSIALSGRINIAVNARGVFIADYGILEENITYLSDEWAPLTKAQIMTAVQALVDESTSLEEIYIYYAGYGSGIQIVKSIDWALMPVPMDIPPMDTLPMNTFIPLPVDDSTITITIDELEPTTTEEILEVPSEATTEPSSEATTEPSSEATTEPSSEATTEPSSEATTEEATTEPPTEPSSEAPTEPSSEAPTEPSTEEATTEPSSEAPTEAPTEPIVPTTEAPTEPVVPTIDPVIPQEPIVPTIDSLIPSFIVLPAPPPPPLPYKYDFYPMTQSYDKLTKQMVGSDYEIITNTEILDMLKNTKCRTICVLDMCPLVGTTEPLTYKVPSFDETTNGTTDLLSNTLTWGTDIIGNVNIISFAEPDSISSGKLATIQVITQHIRG
jgi:hypothetical protein